MRLEALEGRQLLAGDPVINEFLAVNPAGEDWIEIYNPGPATNLIGWRLTNDPANPGQWTFPNTPLGAGQHLVVTADGTQTPPVSQPYHVNFKLDQDGEYLALVKPDWSVASEYSPRFPRQVSNVSYGLGPTTTRSNVVVLASGAAGPAGRYLIPTASDQLEPAWNARGFDDSVWASSGQTGIGYDTLAGGASYDAVIRTDVEPAMHGAGKNRSLFVRMPFEIDGENDFTSLTLRMRYDDGFVAYINGTRVAGANDPASLAWNSGATGTINKNTAFVTFDLTAYRHLLQPGDNVLAIHGLNQSSTDGDFLVMPELVGTRVSFGPAQYMTARTQGAANVAGAQGVVADTEFSVDRGFFDVGEQFSLVISTDTPGAQIRYTTDGSLPTETFGTLYNGPISIGTTTTVRAIAYRPGFISSNVDAQTYIFLDDVIRQDGSNLPPYAFWGHLGPDWEMDPEVVNNPTYAGAIKNDLLSVPTLHLSMPWEDWFAEGRGIYLAGSGIERRTSVELINPDGTKGFHVTSAVEVQGGSSDQRWKDDKLSLELTFKEPYGPTKLDYPLLGDDAVDTFDRIILDGVLNWSWVHAQDSNQRAAAKYLTDQLVADFQNKISGKGAPHGKAMHLYINNLYWGMYYVHEKPTETFAADYYGGEKDAYDVIKHHTNRPPVNGTVANYQNLINLANTDLTLQANYDALLAKLDVVDFIDYMIVNFYSGNNDWAHQNWYASYDTADPAAKWYYHSWDAEHTFINGVQNSTGRDDPVGPTHIHQKLKANPEYRMLFADRVHKHFFNEGVLTPAKAREAFLFRVNEIDRAIVGESARWGDNGQAVPYTRAHWRATIDGLLANYFPNRTNTVLGQFRSAINQLYPATNAPLFDKFGGTFAAATTLTITRPGAQAGTIYYTLDGSDPRLPGGGINTPSAQPYSSTLNISSSRRVRARILNGAEWSALVDATFLIGPPPKLRVSEIMYNPPAAGATSAYLPDDFEFVEVQNTGTTALTLSGYRFTKGITFEFPTAYSLAPGVRAVVAKNLAAFQSRYGTGVNVAGVFVGQLNNGGERLALETNLGQVIEEFTYNDGWYDHTDGGGWSLVAIDPNATDLVLSTKENWRPSTPMLGLPGAADPGFNPGSVVVNEVFVDPSDPSKGWIELRNTTNADVDVGGWFLSDSRLQLTKHRIAGDTVVPAGQYKLIFQPDFAAAFSLSLAGDDVLLSGKDAAGNLGGYREDADFAQVDPSGAFSFGKHIKSTGASDFARMTPTPEAANAYPHVGPVVITEVMYNPRTGGDEFVEIRNVSGQPIELANWKFTSGIGFTFPAGTVLAPGAHALVVGISPETFRINYGIPAAVAVLGPYTGSLNNGGEKLAIAKPTGTVNDPYVEVDRVTYDNEIPWPITPAGTGPSLARVFASKYANDVANWRAETAAAGRTPGATNTGAPYVFFSPVFTYSGGKKLVVQFSENVSASADDLVLRNLDTNTNVTSGITFAYSAATMTATWTLPAGLADANYRATLVASGLFDGAASLLDGDYDGSGGGNQVYDFFHLTGDVNGDRSVNHADFAAVQANFGASGRGWAGGDLNLDGVTDFADFQLLERAFGRTLPPPPVSTQAPPAEPAAVVIAPPPAVVPPSKSRPVAPPKPVNAAAARLAAAATAPPSRFGLARIKPASRRVNDLFA